MLRLGYRVLPLFFALSLVGCSLFSSNDNSLEKGLVGHWTFDSCPSPAGHDCLVESTSGSAPDALMSASGVAEGIVGGAFAFDGVDDYGVIAHDSVFDASARTYQFWFRKNNSTIRDSPNEVDIEGLIIKSFDTGLDRAVSINLRGSTSPFDLVFAVGTGASSLARVELSATITFGRWYHVVGILDQSLMQLFLNGELAGSVQLDSPPVNNRAPIAIGYIPTNHTSTRYFFGSIDDLRFYSRRLSDQDVRKLYGLSESR